uniref:Tyrosine-protein phosphatase non-receptor type 3 n=1 Tax=Ascaris suum TaxID=6253 RepID=F1KYQ4_ASCSU
MNSIAADDSLHAAANVSGKVERNFVGVAKKIRQNPGRRCSSVMLPVSSPLSVDHPDSSQSRNLLRRADSSTVQNSIAKAAQQPCCLRDDEPATSSTSSSCPKVPKSSKNKSARRFQKRRRPDATQVSKHQSFRQTKGYSLRQHCCGSSESSPSICPSVTQRSEKSPRTQDENSSTRLSRRSFIEESMQIYDNAMQRRMKEFVNHCLQTPIKDIVAQFEKLKNIVPLPSNSFIGRLPVNLRKNRYYDIFCLDATRVTLQGQQEDYIHANYVRHKVLQNTFIITQGPLPNTVADFWHMIWQERTGVIFMLCCYTEENKTKCAQYLPNLKLRRLFVAGLQIEIKARSTFHKGRIIKTQIVLSNGKVNLTVMHYQWTSWPDFKIPNEDFKTPFYLLQKSRTSPTSTVVHCSGGVGRSGTLVALEMCLMQLAAGRVLRVSDMVACLRNKRAQSVQTKEQYLFIYRALVDFAISKTIVSQRKAQPFIDKYKRFCFPETAHS